VQAERIIVFDVETTGTDRRRDQVIELSVQFGLDAHSRESGDGQGARTRTWRVRPSVAINPEAQAVHGITMEDLVECPPFGAPGGAGEEFRRIFDEAEILVGYNLAFDIEMLQAEYERLGQPRLDLTGKLVIDPLRMWQQHEPRTLQEAHKRFVGGEFEAAHTATADVQATGRVLRGMMSAFGIETEDWSAVARSCGPGRKDWVGPSRHIRWSSEGSAVLGFGKHSGTPVRDLARGAGKGYLQWLLSKDFPAHVHDICNRALELDADGFDGWIHQTFGGPRASQEKGAS
jgi:DNA polymerase-3 subunit epsilon